MIGLDTGFFVELLKNNSDAVKIWNEILDGEYAFVSCFSLYELEKLALRGAIDDSAVATLREAIMALCSVVWIDNIDILVSAANLSQGLGMHAADALILAGFIKNDVKIVYTTDSDFSLYKKKGVKIVVMNEKNRHEKY